MGGRISSDSQLWFRICLVINLPDATVGPSKMFLSPFLFPVFSLKRHTHTHTFTHSLSLLPAVISLCLSWLLTYFVMHHMKYSAQLVMKTSFKGMIPPFCFFLSACDVFFLCVSFVRLLSSIKPGLVKKINRLPTPIAGLVSPLPLLILYTKFTTFPPKLKAVLWSSWILFFPMLSLAFPSFALCVSYSYFLSLFSVPVSLSRDRMYYRAATCLVTWGYGFVTLFFDKYSDTYVPRIWEKNVLWQVSVCG